MEQDFCLEERRSREDERNVLNNKMFKPYFIYYQNKILGYFSYLEFEDFIFGEHFAILEELRDKGFGTEFFKYFLARLTKPLVFEIEKPTNKQSKRRKKFYDRLNSIYSKYKYFQPSYHEDGIKFQWYLCIIQKL